MKSSFRKAWNATITQVRQPVMLFMIGTWSITVSTGQRDSKSYLATTMETVHSPLKSTTSLYIQPIVRKLLRILNSPSQILPWISGLMSIASERIMENTPTSRKMDTSSGMRTVPPFEWSVHCGISPKINRPKFKPSYSIRLPSFSKTRIDLTLFWIICSTIWQSLKNLTLQRSGW